MALGYDKEDMAGWSFDSLPAVNSSKPLTERGKHPSVSYLFLSAYTITDYCL